MTHKFISLWMAIFLLVAGCATTASLSQTALPLSNQGGTSTHSSMGEDAETQTSDSISEMTYPIVDTAQITCYDNNAEIPCSTTEFFGQDAQYTGNTPRYQDNGDGTITDLVTGLMWQQDPGEKMTYDEAVAGASSFDLAGYTDWRLPTIKELYSLILFDGADVSACPGGTCSATPFIDTNFFKFSYGDTSNSERVIDSQFASSTKYVSTTMGGNATMFGVNFADGRIKGYPTDPMPGQSSGKLFYVLYVRGNTDYGVNSFVDNGDGTISDNATGLMWAQDDSGSGMNWEDALAWVEEMNSQNYLGYSDWRLPNAKELQSIVDYSRSPDTTDSAAIDPLFNVTPITNEVGQVDFPFYWSSTTHADSSGRGSTAVYIAFGRALGFWNGSWMDVHGAGAQRSDPKSGDPAQYTNGHGPQGDAVRIDNYVRLVRGGDVTETPEGNPNAATRPAMTIQSTGIDQNHPGNMPQQGGQPGQQGSQRQPGDAPNGNQPPQEAIDACAGLDPGDACSINTPNGTQNGTCSAIHSGQLACFPANAPQKPVQP